MKHKKSLVSSMTAKLPNQDSATGRGIKTAIQTIVGALIVFGTGLVTTINGVPGCPDAVLNYFRDNVVQLVGSLGVSAGFVTFIWNLFRKDVKNY